jgi:hypothetical protein
MNFSNNTLHWLIMLHPINEATRSFGARAFGAYGATRTTGSQMLCSLTLRDSETATALLAMFQLCL